MQAKLSCSSLQLLCSWAKKLSAARSEPQLKPAVKTKPKAVCLLRGKRDANHPLALATESQGMGFALTAWQQFGFAAWTTASASSELARAPSSSEWSALTSLRLRNRRVYSA